MAPSTTNSMFNRLRGKVLNEPPHTNPSYAEQYRQRVGYVPPSRTDLGFVEYGNTPPPLSPVAAYSYAPPPSPQGTQSDFYYAPADQSQTSLQTPTYPIAPDAPEGWHAQWVQSQNRFAFKKDGTSIITWVDDSPISESRAAYYVTGERATTIELLQIYMKRQPNTHGQPLIDRGLFEKEGVEWGISDSNRLIYDSIFESYAPTEGYISLPFASNMFQQTGMSNVVAGLILDLVRPKDPGESLLNMARFAVAMHLIYRTLNDYPVPTALPYQLTSVLTSELSNPAIIASQPAPPPASKPALVPPEPRLPEDGDWSGRGQHVEYLRNEAIPLVVSDHLGRGASADVHKVTTTGGVVVARKLIYCARAVKLDDVKRELEILRKVDHKHVIKLVGSYTQGRQLGILLYPAAVCDLGTFLDEIDEQQKKWRKRGK